MSRIPPSLDRPATRLALLDVRAGAPLRVHIWHGEGRVVMIGFVVGCGGHARHGPCCGGWWRC